MLMQPNQQTFWLIEPEAKPLQQIIGGGFILPDGQVAYLLSAQLSLEFYHIPVMPPFHLYHLFNNCKIKEGEN